MHMTDESAATIKKEDEPQTELSRGSDSRHLEHGLKVQQGYGLPALVFPGCSMKVVHAKNTSSRQLAGEAEREPNTAAAGNPQSCSDLPLTSAFASVVANAQPGSTNSRLHLNKPLNVKREGLHFSEGQTEFDGDCPEALPDNLHDHDSVPDDLDFDCQDVGFRGCKSLGNGRALSDNTTNMQTYLARLLPGTEQKSDCDGDDCDDCDDGDEEDCYDMDNRHDSGSSDMFKDRGTPKRKAGRPILCNKDPNSADLTDEQRRVLKRRMSNREYARRARQRRQELIKELQGQINSMHQENEVLLEEIRKEERHRATLRKQIKLITTNMAFFVKENTRLRSQYDAIEHYIQTSGFWEVQDDSLDEVQPGRLMGTSKDSSDIAMQPSHPHGRQFAMMRALDAADMTDPVGSWGDSQLLCRSTE